MSDAIGRRNAIRFMMARGELGGAHMADGHARVSGGLGVISTGPGAANAVGGLIEARFSGSFVLHITGQTATKFVDRDVGTVHDVPDQLGWALARRAGATVHKLLDLGFTMINNINGKGTVSEEHPMNLGGLHGNGMPKVQQEKLDLTVIVMNDRGYGVIKRIQEPFLLQRGHFPRRQRLDR